MQRGDFVIARSLQIFLSGEDVLLLVFVTEFSVSLQLYLHSTFYWMDVSLLDAFKIPAEYTLPFTEIGRAHV